MRLDGMTLDELLMMCEQTEEDSTLEEQLLHLRLSEQIEFDLLLVEIDRLGRELRQRSASALDQPAPSCYAVAG